MRQEGRRAVAPLNTDPRWPDGYIGVLRDLGAVEKTIPYCVAWARSFFARFLGRRRRDLGRTEIEIFLTEQSRRGGCKPSRATGGSARNVAPISFTVSEWTLSYLPNSDTTEREPHGRVGVLG